MTKNNGIFENEQVYYLSTYDAEDGKPILYESDLYKLSEIDIINLIKICVVEKRSKSIGEKILAMYRDSTEHKKDNAEKKLELIGIKNEKKEPTRPKKFRVK